MVDLIRKITQNSTSTDSGKQLKPLDFVKQAFQQTSIREVLFYLGPGFLISVAYIDPGNWATNISGGAHFGTALLWVIILVSLMAMLIQIIAAKLGIATGKGVAALCRERLSRPVIYILWIAAELAMIATDMAEIIGAAIGFSLILHLPLLAGAILAAAASFGLLGIKTAYDQGYRIVEFVIMALAGIVAISFLFEMFLANPTLHSIGSGLLPSLPGPSSLYIAIGILGATVMPHSVYLHSILVQDRRKKMIENNDETEEGHHHHFHLEVFDTSTALLGAMFVNAAMLIVAASALMGTGISTLKEAYITLNNVFGQHSSLVFGIALIAAGISSSLVATMAGQTVMDGFLDLKISVWWRRSATLVPSLAVVAAGFEATKVLVASQVALSFELPFVLIPLLIFTTNKKIMGSFINHKVTTWVLGAIVGLISLLNVWLLYSTIFGG
jgi:manganese transport protein